jgi:hypothetical protein
LTLDALSMTQLRLDVGFASRARSVVSTVGVVWNALPLALLTGTVFSSTTRFALPSTSKSMRKLKKC